MADNMTQLNDLAKARRQRIGVRRIANSAEHLISVIRKKFETCFIFPLSEFEHTFGPELWGFGLPEDQLTEAQKANRLKWEAVRNNILNKGNTQSRAVVNELGLYDVNYVGYRTSFVGGNGNGTEPE